MDGTDAVMLSGETAVGRYPVKAIRAMAEVCKGAEKFPLPEGLTRHRIGDYFGRVDEAIAMAVMYTANHLRVTAIIALTESGSTARWMSRIRSDIPIYALTPHATTSRRVTIYRGVYPVPFNAEHAEGGPYRDVFDTLLQRDLAKPGDYVIVTKGDIEGVSGGTNAMTIVQVTEAG
jgi:pyruvate kinase